MLQHRWSSHKHGKLTPGAAWPLSLLMSIIEQQLPAPVDCVSLRILRRGGVADLLESTVVDRFVSRH